MGANWGAVDSDLVIGKAETFGKRRLEGSLKLEVMRTGGSVENMPAEMFLSGWGKEMVKREDGGGGTVVGGSGGAKGKGVKKEEEGLGVWEEKIEVGERGWAMGAPGEGWVGVPRMLW